MNNKEEIEFYGEIKWETRSAMLVFDGVNEIWIPKSQMIRKRHISGKDWEIIIPYWMAKEKDII